MFAVSTVLLVAIAFLPLVWLVDFILSSIVQILTRPRVKQLPVEILRAPYVPRKVTRYLDQQLLDRDTLKVLTEEFEGTLEELVELAHLLSPDTSRLDPAGFDLR